MLTDKAVITVSVITGISYNILSTIVDKLFDQNIQFLIHRCFRCLPLYIYIYFASTVNLPVVVNMFAWVQEVRVQSPNLSSQKHSNGALSVGNMNWWITIHRAYISTICSNTFSILRVTAFLCFTVWPCGVQATCCDQTWRGQRRWSQRHAVVRPHVATRRLFVAHRIVPVQTPASQLYFERVPILRAL